jgi:hypothetical protein
MNGIKRRRISIADAASTIAVASILLLGGGVGLWAFAGFAKFLNVGEGFLLLLMQVVVYLLPCLATALACSVLGVSVAAGIIPGSRLKDWGRARGIVLWSVGLAWCTWFPGAAIAVWDLQFGASLSVPQAVQGAVLCAMLFVVRWSWPRSLSGIELAGEHDGEDV